MLDILLPYGPKNTKLAKKKKTTGPTLEVLPVKPSQDSDLCLQQFCIAKSERKTKKNK